MRKGTVKELGDYKEKIMQMLYSDTNIHDILYGSQEPDIEKFKNCVKSHLFTEDTLQEKGTFIFFDTYIPDMRTNTKQVNILMFCMCHRDLIDNTYSKEGFYGNRSDILTQMVEQCLCDPHNSRLFGIGFQLESVDFLNTMHYCGFTLNFTAECFR